MAVDPMLLVAKSPCRVDFAGGTLDIWPLYLNHDHAVTVNFAVNLYTHARIESRSDKKIILETRDLGGREEFDSIDHLAATKKFKLPLLAYALRWYRPETGVHIVTNSEAPAGAGISGSSSLLITLGAALNKLSRRGYSLEKIREVAQNIEAQIIQVPTGCQDYYPAMYGSVSAIELSCEGIARKEIKLPHQELADRGVLVYTGKPRNSGINNWEVNKAYIDGDKTVRRNFDKITSIAVAMRSALEQSNWDEAGRLLREEWSFRRKNAPTISTDLLDAIAEKSRKAGAKGFKVCGAGGGGCCFLLVEKGAKEKVSQLVRDLGAQVLDFAIAPKGVQVKVSA
ncbi:MAG: GHMP kinase [Acidobacteria bacterium]|nr:GHMP kinase [Acidobacteriota bacterium]